MTRIESHAETGLSRGLVVFAMAGFLVLQCLGCSGSVAGRNSNQNDANQNNTNQNNTSSHSVCGNGIVEIGELCEPGDPGDETCESLGYTGGALHCNPNTCNWFNNICYSCGDGHCMLAYGERPDLCPHDCYFICGDGQCEQFQGETDVNCSQDCGWVSVSAGGSMTCGIKRDATVRCWGSNLYFQLGGEPYWLWGEPGMWFPDNLAAPALEDATVVSVGNGHACATTTAQEVWCWGANSGGQLGIGTTVGPETWLDYDCSSVPMLVDGLGQAQTVIAGGGYSCALLLDGTVWCWGNGKLGTLGDGVDHHPDCEPYNCSAVPVQTSLLNDAVAISAGSGHACALLSDDTVWCWGSNDVGQLGTGSLVGPEDCQTLPNLAEAPCARTPVQVVGLPSVVSISASWLHTCALASDGTVWCWGSNFAGELGDQQVHQSCLWNNHELDCSPSAVQAVGVADGVAVSAGWVHSCVIIQGGSLWCWGWNYYGQLGNLAHFETCSGIPDEPCEAGPSPVTQLSNVVAVTAAERHTCAIGSNGRLYCWGDNNDSGLLGGGDLTGDATALPVRVVY